MKKSKLLAVCLSLILVLGTVASCGGTSEKNKVSEIQENGKILVGTTGDYKPMSYLDSEKNEYEGFDKELADLIGEKLGVDVEFVATTWPDLAADMQAGKFDIAISGITRTNERMQTMSMSDGYLSFGKTILCQKDKANRFKSLEDIDQSDVVVMVNPGGTNEAFAKENLKKAKIVVHEKNAEIPAKIAKGEADIMITETVEALRYLKELDGIAAPLVDKPFTKGQFGVLMQQGDQDFVNYINFLIEDFKNDGTIDRLYKKYIK